MFHDFAPDEVCSFLQVTKAETLPHYGSMALRLQDPMA
jgi:hypothetical protein